MAGLLTRALTEDPRLGRYRTAASARISRAYGRRISFSRKKLWNSVLNAHVERAWPSAESAPAEQMVRAPDDSAVIIALASPSAALRRFIDEEIHHEPFQTFLASAGADHASP